MAETTKRYAIVTGANKGLGFGICKLLVAKGIVVVLTARDEKRGLDAVEKLKEDFGGDLSNQVIFHQLDVTDHASVAALANFVKAKFGKLDILVNNAAMGGYILDAEALRASGIGKVNNAGIGGSSLDAEALSALGIGKQAVDWSKIATETSELAEECLETNYYGVKRMVDEFVNLLQLSDSPRIVNVSSRIGKLQFLPEGWAKEVLSNVENLTEEKINEVLKEFLKDFKEGSLQSKGWPIGLSAYTVSKIALNAYTRVLAKKYPTVCINCVCPGFVKTDLNCNTGFTSPEEAAEGPVRLALLPDGSPSGRFFLAANESSYE